MIEPSNARLAADLALALISLMFTLALVRDQWETLEHRWIIAAALFFFFFDGLAFFAYDIFGVLGARA